SVWLPPSPHPPPLPYTTLFRSRTSSGDGGEGKRQDYEALRSAGHGSSQAPGELCDARRKAGAFTASVSGARPFWTVHDLGCPAPAESVRCGEREPRNGGAPTRGPTAGGGVTCLAKY